MFQIELKPILLPHCFDGIRHILIRQFLRILEFEESIAPVAGQINQHITLTVTQQTPYNHMGILRWICFGPTNLFLGVFGGNRPVRSRTKFSAVTSYPLQSTSVSSKNKFRWEWALLKMDAIFGDKFHWEMRQNLGMDFEHCREYYRPTLKLYCCKSFNSNSHFSIPFLPIRQSQSFQ